MISSTLLLAITNKSSYQVEQQLSLINSINELTPGAKQDPILTSVAQSDEKIYKLVKEKIITLGGNVSDFINKPCTADIYNKGLYPIHLAIISGNHDLLDMMINDGATIDQLSIEGNNKNGRTPLQVATERKCHTCFIKLIQLKADWTKVDSKNLHLFNYFDDIFFNRLLTQINLTIDEPIGKSDVPELFDNCTGTTIYSSNGSRQLQPEEQDAYLKSLFVLKLSEQSVNKLCQAYFKDCEKFELLKQKQEEEASAQIIPVTTSAEIQISAMEKVFYKNVDAGRENAALAFIKSQKDIVVLNRLLDYVKTDVLKDAITKKIQELAI